MPRRILIHPGFHKTGTSSMQHFLWQNRVRLSPHVSLLMLRHLKPAAKVCMTFSHQQNPYVLTDLVEVMDAIIAEHLPQSAPDLVISCEGLSGHLPGWPKVNSYGAAPITAAYLSGYLAERFPQAEQSFVYSTRTAADWVWSAWRHHLMSHRMIEDWEVFAARMAPAADLAAMAAEVAEAIAPVPVFTLPLDEAMTHPQGPGGALLELIDLPEAVRASLIVVPEANRGPDAALAAEYLRLNRSRIRDDALKAEKLKLAEKAGVGGWSVR
jgi:hypothetical protein